MRLFVLVFVVACGQPASECLSDFYEDADGDGHGDPENSVTGCVAPDGYATTQDDCDDGNAEIHPGADELCNGIDDDCDGNPDPFPAGYLDQDGDGYGWGPENCGTPSASAAPVDGDCDDHDAAVNPDAVEVCNGIDDDCDGPADEDAIDLAVYHEDSDGDGYGATRVSTTCKPLPAGATSDASDCDDKDPDVNPDASETCDGTDNDCDGLVDDDDPSRQGPELYADNDGDGYGDPDTSAISCDPIPGMVVDATDCDDATAAVNPRATEICNTIDDNCDGLTDDDDDYDARVIGRRIFYYDEDEDSLGGPSAVYVCSAPTGYVDSTGDCDDTDPHAGPWVTMYRDTDHDGFGDFPATRCGTPDADWVLRDGDCDDTLHDVFPGAAELCDGIDDNCNGLTDDDDPSTRWPTFYPDLDGDGYGGDPITGSCDPPLQYTLTDDGDCDDTRATTNPGAPELCVNSRDDDCDGVIDPCAIDLNDADWSLIGPPAKSAATRGFTVLATDLNADGWADLVATAPDLDPPVYVFFGPKAGTSTLKGADVRLLSHNAFTLAGGMGAADVDADGRTDLLVGAPDDHVAYLFLGPFTAGDHGPADTEFKVPEHGPSATVAKILPDFDGDGSPDVVVNAIDLEDGALEGTVYVAPATTTAKRPLSLPKDATYIYEGAPYDELGASVVAIGDVTDDGVEDLAIGAAGLAVFVLPGGEPGGTYTLDVAVGTLCSPREDGFGYSIAATDADGDGAADLFVGAPHDGGSVYGFLGPLTPSARNTGEAYVHWIGADGLGYSVATGGDVDDDGAPDVLLGAYDSDHHRGHAYLSLRGAEGVVDVEDLLTFNPPVEGNATGYDVAFLSDWSLDGGTDVVFGEPFFSTEPDFSSSEGEPGHARVDVVYSQHLY